MIDGTVYPVRAGSAVLFPQGKVHMLQNSGTEEMKVACFFAPPSSLDTYKFFEDVDFPEACSSCRTCRRDAMLAKTRVTGCD